MYEFLILSQLMKNSAHGYLIAKIINDIIGPYARVSNGRLYPLLAKMEQAGLIAVRTEPASAPPGDRQLRVYEITEAGRKRYRVLIMDTTLNPGEYQKLFSLKVCDFAFLWPENDPASNKEHIERVIHVMRHYIDEWQLEYDWAKSLREKEIVQAHPQDSAQLQNQP